MGTSASVAQILPLSPFQARLRRAVCLLRGTACSEPKRYGAKQCWMAGLQVSTCWSLDVGESTMQDDARRIGCATSTHVEPVAEGGIAGSQVNFHGSCQMHLSTSLFEGNCAHRFLWVLDFFGLDRLDRLKEHAREREQSQNSSGVFLYQSSCLLVSTMVGILDPIDSNFSVFLGQKPSG